jgi:hypothetical protein
MAHEVGDLIWDYTHSSLGVIVATGCGKELNEKRFTIMVKVFNLDSNFLYTEEMIDGGKTYLQEKLNECTK